MKKIEFYPGINLDKAYQELQDNAPCYGEFNEKTLYSTDSLDEVFVKVAKIMYFFKYEVKNL